MKIKSIELKNYKAFYGKHTIRIDGKNAFIYGENGSGKSSLYFALKDFFQSSTENIDLNEVENIFIKPADAGKCHIKVAFKPGASGGKAGHTYSLSAAAKDTNSRTDTSIKDANNLKSFLTYKHLLDIHHVKKGEKIDLFNLLVKGVLKHFKYSLTAGKELGAMWQEVERIAARPPGRSYPSNVKKKELNDALKSFNTAFKELFRDGSPEHILTHAKPILDQFGHKIELKLDYPGAKPKEDLTGVLNNHVSVKLKYAGKDIREPHLFLNEARLSAIAISIYLGMIRRHPQLLKYKILFLDDIFIGLDISNRLPLLDILSTHFSEYQVFITTYDKPWYEYAKSFLEAKGGWTTIELYTVSVKDGFEIPRINDKTGFLDRAAAHFNESDYKAAAVYARSAFENIVQAYCDNKLPVKYQKKSKKYTSEDFWTAIKAEGRLLAATVTEVEKYRELVLNPFSHYNTEKHEIHRELDEAIKTIRILKDELFPPPAPAAAITAPAATAATTATAAASTTIV